MEVGRVRARKPATERRLPSLEDDDTDLRLERDLLDVTPHDRELLAVLVAEHTVLANEEVDVLEEEHRHRAEAEDQARDHGDAAEQAHETTDSGRHAADE